MTLYEGFKKKEVSTFRLTFSNMSVTVTDILIGWGIILVWAIL